MHRRAAVSLSAAVTLAVGVGVAHAPPPPPPPPDVYEQMLSEGCDGSQTKAEPTRVPVHAEGRTAKDLGLRDEAAGKLVFKSGVRLRGDALRVGALKGLSLTGKWGLVAVSDSKQWLVFDLQHGDLSNLNAVGVAPMAGAPGSPTWLHDSVYGTLYVGFGDQKATYPLDICGFAAKAILSPYFNGDMSSSTHVGWHVASVTDPDAHMPDLRPGTNEHYLLLSPNGGGSEAVVERKVSGATPVEVGRLPFRASTMVAEYSGSEIVFLFTAPTKRPDELDLYLFSLTP